MKRASETQLQTRRSKYERQERIASYREEAALYETWGTGTILCYQLKHPPSLVSLAYRAVTQARDLFLMREFYDLAHVSSKEQRQFGQPSHYYQYRRNITCVPFQGVFNKYELDDIFVPVLIHRYRFQELFGRGREPLYSSEWDLYVRGPPPPASQFTGSYAIFL